VFKGCILSSGYRCLRKGTARLRAEQEIWPRSRAQLHLVGKKESVDALSPALRTKTGATRYSAAARGSSKDGP
jgi:hypothetical protein